MKINKTFGATVRLALANVILLLLVACPERLPPSEGRPVSEASAGEPAEADSRAAAGSPTESWQCRNDLEVHCGEGACEAKTGGDFTPMSVTVDDSGAMSVCAYSGCWEGTGKVSQDEQFLVLIGHALEFSTSRESEAAEADVVIAIDRTDAVATLKVAEFALPLLCEVVAGAR